VQAENGILCGLNGKRVRRGQESISADNEIVVVVVVVVAAATRSEKYARRRR
jgi:hypothetical protein